MKYPWNVDEIYSLRGDERANASKRQFASLLVCRQKTNKTTTRYGSNNGDRTKFYAKICNLEFRLRNRRVRHKGTKKCNLDRRTIK